jgi:hypothetical protein
LFFSVLQGICYFVGGKEPFYIGDRTKINEKFMYSTTPAE